MNFRGKSRGQLRPPLLSTLLFVASLILLLKHTDAQELPEYISYTGHLNEKAFPVDKDSIVLIGGKRNYLRSGVYGIVEYELYKKTGKEEHKTKCLSQIKFLTNPKNYDVLNDGTNIGYRHDHARHGVQPPWYSGLTQGVISSYYLRCFDLTRDSTMLDFAKKVGALMVMPRDKYGALAKTKDKDQLTWVEEYPTSNKNVLNGFIAAVVGMHEYLLFFENEKMRQVYEECLNTLEKTLPKYDTPDWTNYSKDNSPITRYYMKLQIEQLKHMYLISGIREFYLQSVLWSVFAYGKDIQFKRDGYINRNYDYSVPLVKIEDKNFLVDTSRVLNIENRTNLAPPQYAHYISKVDSCDQEQKVSLKVKAKNKGQIITFYRSNDDLSKMNRTNWKVSNSIEGRKGIIDPENEYYQLMVVFSIQHDWLEVKSIKTKHRHNTLAKVNAP